ncbi:MAG: DNA mismatch endonuclease Vsr [Pelomonas sp.]|nr:DNA mismatch endonuclease Vsr [Roseateles sp.]
MMSAIGSRDTRPELLVRRYLHGAGLRFKLHDKSLPGTPDIVLPKFDSVIFVHGCFWHRHSGCRFAAIPATRTEFWSSKFTSNVNRDAGNGQALRALGWRVFTIWECEASNELILDQCVWLVMSGLDQAA